MLLRGMRGLRFSRLQLLTGNHSHVSSLTRRQLHQSTWPVLPHHYCSIGARVNWVSNFLARVAHVCSNSGHTLPSLALRLRMFTRPGISLCFKNARFHQSWRIPRTVGLLAFLSCGCVMHHLKQNQYTNFRAACLSSQDSGEAIGQQLVPEPESLDTAEIKFTLLQQIWLSLRLIYLGTVFFPAVLLHCLSYLFGSPYLSDLGWRYLMVAIQIAGPAFVKLGQWASTRRDIFSEEFCNTLSQLHTRCNPHSWNKTAEFLRENFGERWEDELVIFDHSPVGSGCVAQVYKGYLDSEAVEQCQSQRNRQIQVMERTRTVSNRSEVAMLEDWNRSKLSLTSTSNTSTSGRRFIPIAVKVLHPGVVEAMEVDITLMKYVASWVDYVYPDVHWVALKECVDQFSVIMTKQLDLQLEAENLRKFQDLLGGYSSVKFPTPIHPFVTRSVLVESFEQGTLISNFMDKPGGALQKNLAKIGIEVILDMVFIHNFVHGDLHPGNILVQDGRGGRGDPKLVLLDCGIATSLGRQDLENIKAVFTAIVKGEGKKVADLLLGIQHCATAEEYREKMAEIVETGRCHLNLKETRVGTLLTSLFNLLIEHKVRIEPNYTSVMVAVMVIEGLGRSLDPTLDLLSAARSCLLHTAKQSLRGHN